MEAVSISTFISTWVEEHREEMIQWRRHLHQNPELSHMETATTAFITHKLQQAGASPQPLPATGVTVDLGPENAPLIAFRGDIDALPISENTGLEFSSHNPGVMHACGHDIHTAIVLALACGVADYIREYGVEAMPVRVRCIFQPAEEVMDGGAVEVIEAGALRGVQSIFAVHCEPKLRTGEIGVRTGPITSASDVVEVVLRGHGGHTSRPHLTTDLIYAAGLIITQLPGLLTRRLDPRSSTVVVFGSVNGGATFNAIPQEVRLRGTFRTAHVRVWRQGERILRELVQQIVAPTGAAMEIHYTKGVPPVVNDDVATALVAQAVKAVDPHALREAPQSTGGEDFSWYLEHVPGSMVRLGAWDGTGEKTDLHQPEIVFDERAIGVGVRLFAGVIDQYAVNP